MTEITLQQLNQSFNEIWSHGDRIPVLLEQWQALVAEFMANVEPTEKLLADLERSMDQWQDVLEKNREILEDQQISLKQDLQQGEPDAKKLKASKQYKR